MIHINKGLLVLLVSVLILGLALPVSTERVSAEEGVKALVIYTAKEEEIGEKQRTLDMLISHFTTDITFISSNDVLKEDLKGVTHLFYYGIMPADLPSTFDGLFDDFYGTFTAIGYNSDQLSDQFSFMKPLHERGITELSLTNNPEKILQDVPLEIIDIEFNAATEVLIEGKNKDNPYAYPVMIRNGDHYYYSLDSVQSNELVLFGEVLHDIFEADHGDQHPAYMRLEDVHPLVDPSNVKEIADVLKEKGIPYMIAVIPVYTDPETGTEFHLADSPKLLKQLKKMQKDGASIVLHGYTHQFRSSETGEGFEFWDVENNTPIYAPADEAFTLKEESAFSSKQAYETYMHELQAHETAYIKDKLTKGIRELTNYGLYPLAFEAPHYTMSQNGYKVASEYFSTYAGQLQLSDEDWLIMDSSPYITKPSFLHGMELLPETIGYVDPHRPQSISEMMDAANNMSQTKDGVIAGFYHPYLGVEGFKKLINKMEKLPNMTWIDLKDRDVWVKTDQVHISTEDGAVIVDVNKSKMTFSSLDFFSYHYFQWSNTLSWALSIIGALAVLVFAILTVINFNRRKIV